MFTLFVNFIISLNLIFSFLIIYMLNIRKISSRKPLQQKKGLLKLGLIRKRNFCTLKIKRDIFLKLSLLYTSEEKLLKSYIEYTGNVYDRIPLREFNNILLNDLKLNSNIIKDIRDRLIEKNNIKEMVGKTKEGKSFRCLTGLKIRGLIDSNKELVELSLLKKKNYPLNTDKKISLSIKQNGLKTYDLLTHYVEYTGQNSDEISIKNLNNILINYLKLTKIEIKTLRYKLLNRPGVKEMVRKDREQKSYRCITGLKVKHNKTYD